MEQNNDTALLLELLNGPAFSVKDGVITLCNTAAQMLSISPGTAAKELISIGAEEYDTMEGGCLYLTVTIGGAPFGASVSRLSGYDLFLLESGQDQPELAALGLASRELRGPLSDLKMISGHLLPKLGKEDQEWAGAMNRSIYRLMRILNNMSNAQSFANDSRNHMQELQVGALLKELAQQELAPLLEQVGIDLCYTDNSQGTWCMVDEYKLKQAVYALISNAATYTPKGGSIRVTVKRSGTRLALTVTDSGSGIPDNVMGSVFSRFRRTDMAEDSRAGIGLGLVLVRSVATIHGGTTMIDRPAEGGTRVTVTIPIREGRDYNLSSRMPDIVIPSTGDALINLSDILPNSLYAPNQVD